MIAWADDSTRRERYHRGMAIAHRESRTKHFRIGIACAVQYASAAAGDAWGRIALHGVGCGLFMWSGLLSVLLLMIEWRRWVLIIEQDSVRPSTSSVCLGLGLYALGLMAADPFLWCDDGEQFVACLLCLVPFLLGTGSLARTGAWPGVAGAALFFAISVAVCIHNELARMYGCGFLGRWVS